VRERWTSSSLGRTVAQCMVLLEGLVEGGLGGIVLCPGSRSTPIAVAIAHLGLEPVVGLDEREAAFFALGWARASGSPIGVVTTSGTAALELAPALAEAREAGIGLLALTADRPRWAHGIGAPQTLDQAHILGAIATTIDVELSDAIDADRLAGIAHEVLARTQGASGGSGPVVVNLGIAEPLLVPEEVRLGPWHPREVAVARPAVMEEAWIRRWLDPTRAGWLVVGEDATLEGPTACALGEHLGWPVLSDALAGVPAGPWCLEHPELALRAMPGARPEVIVVLGAPHASRTVNERIDELARSGVPVAWLTGRPGWRDPARRATTAATVDLGAVVAAGLAGPRGSRLPADDPLLAKDRAIAAAISAVEGAGEASIARALARSLVAGESLVVASSLPVRHLEVFAGRLTAGVRVHANRGANGIDGTVATWLGVARGSDALSVLITGDLAALYGLGALWQLPLPERGLMLVLENEGGVIFDRVAPARLLDEETQRDLFITPPRHSAAELAARSGHELVEVGAGDDLMGALRRARAGSLLLARYRTTRSATNTELDRLYAVARSAE